MHFIIKNLKRVLIVAFAIVIHFQTFAEDQIWKPQSFDKMKSDFKQIIKPLKASYFTVDLVALKSTFSQAPKERKGKIRDYGKIISLPVPDGGFQRFAFASYDIMEAGLREKWKFASAYTGQGIDDPMATIKVDFTEMGFHYQILSPKGQFYVDPVFLGDDRFYEVYKKSDLDIRSKGTFIEYGVEDEHNHGLLDKSSGAGNSVFVTGDVLRTYRIAIAATAEYTTFHGGATQAASAIVTTLNRVNGLYENDVAIRFVLVANNNLLIYTNANSDPYTNQSGPTMLGQNQTNVIALIGTANFDIGHVFSTGGGGIAGLGVVCNSTNKARGVTGSNSPVGDPFDIDYVAHEVGHQFGGNHTFNSVTGSCGGNNRSGNSAYEPGSGSTIMAYAGLCGGDDLQSNSNAYFHFKSYEDIVTYTNTGGGNACPVKTQTGNTAPVIPAMTGGFVLPIGTPFKLTASLATDVDNDVLSYCWEENDLGAGGSLASPVGNAPIFRTFSPVSGRERIFPRLANLLANNTAASTGERYPTIARNLNFKLTVRDNNAGAGGSRSATLNMTVNATGGAFAVVSPNTTAISWEAGSNQTITWTPGATASAPFNSPKVRIKLSLDGGTTFPFTLKDTTQNDGSELVTLPVSASNTCRIMVESVGNVFFDVSNANFKITPTTTAVIGVTVKDTAVCAGSTFKVAITPTGTTYLAGNVFSLQLSNSAGVFTNPVTIGTKAATGYDSITATIPASSVSGTGYKLRIVSSNPVRTGSQIYNAPKIKALPSVPNAITGTTSICANDTTKIFSTTPVAGVLGYNWTVPNGSTILTNPNAASIRIRFGGQTGAITVSASNSCGAGPSVSLNITPVVITPAVVTATSSTTTPCLGTPITLTANPTNGGLTPTFQWLKNDTVIAGATNQTYSTSNLATGNKFKVILFSSLNCGTPNVDTSTQVSITVNIPKKPTVAIEANTLNDTSCTGEPITFTSFINSGGGTSPQYAWFKNTTQIQGQTGQTLIVNNLVSTDSIRLRLTVTGNCLVTNQVFSAGSRIKIITLAPNAGVDTSLCPNSTFTFSGLPAGGQWSGTGVNAGGTYTGGPSGSTVLTYTVDRYGCTRTDNKTVSIAVLPDVNYLAIGYVLSGTALGATSWNWYLNDVIIPNANSATYTIEESGLYCAEAVFPTGCTKKSACFQQIFTSSKDNIQDSQNLTVYPNPAENQIRIFWKGKLSSFQIYNMTGQAIAKFAAPVTNEEAFEYSIPDLPKGIYKLVGLTETGQRSVHTFVKE
jgi:hypothetical protein